MAAPKPKAVVPARAKIPGAGRPPIYSLALAERVCERMAGGEALVGICTDPDMPGMSTVFRWLNDPERNDFRERYAHARAVQAHIYAEQAIAIVDSEPDPARARVRFDARRWYAGKLMPKVYGDKVQHDVEASGQVLIVTGVVRGPEDIEGDAEPD